MKRFLPCLLISLLPTLACADLAEETEQARATAGQLAQQLGGALKKELAAGGPEGAIGVCKQMAPDIAGQLSRQSGSRVARVSLRVRNAMLGHPDAWEQGVLAEFDRRAAAGEKPETLEHAEVVTEPAGRYFRYMKAIPVQPLCLNCHGSTDTIAPGVRDRLATDYPHDRAVGYGVGQIRGAVTIKKPF
ncbi:MAG: DUF3365 domain-containing protein [Burkholderiales bacterium]